MSIPYCYVLELLDARVDGAAQCGQKGPIYIEDDLYREYDRGVVGKYYDASTPEPNLLYRNYILRPESSRQPKPGPKSALMDAVIDMNYELAEIKERIKKLEKGVKKWH